MSKQRSSIKARKRALRDVKRERRLTAQQLDDLAARLVQRGLASHAITFDRNRQTTKETNA